MSGHSKWATIRRKKEAIDSKRAGAFTKITREIIVAAKSGGGDPEHNFKLRLAVLKAKSVNMPNDNIQRAIKRGAGETGEVNQYDEVYYEGYGPGGVAILVQGLTDNRNRTASDMRYIFSRNNGNLGEAGCVSWIFTPKGLITINAEDCNLTEEELFEKALEAGAEDLKASDDAFEIYTDPANLEEVRKYLDSQTITLKSVELTMIPQNTVEVTGEQVPQLMKLIDALEDNDDVQNVYGNFDIPDSELNEL